MNVDYENIRTEVECLENCKPGQEQPDAPIVNLDANFVIPEEDQGKDGVFPRLFQMHQMFEAAEKAGSLVDLRKIPERQRQTRPYRKPDYADEWKSLRKAWSLSRNGKTDLATEIIRKTSGQFYAADPLENLNDWLWRFGMFICQPSFEQPFRNALEEIKPLYEEEIFKTFGKAYSLLSPKRADRYLAVMSEFFSSFSEFSQVYFFVSKGIPVPDGHKAASSDFEATKMFYGNTYEHFAKLIEYFALVNNMIQGREHDTFQQLTLDQYRRLDNPARFNPFSSNLAFSAVCSEADNQIRNASHHGSFNFNSNDQIIRYRSGKGGEGAEHEIPYITYLERCVRLFLQLMTLLRVELMVAHHTKLDPPI